MVAKIWINMEVHGVQCRKTIFFPEASPMFMSNHFSGYLLISPVLLEMLGRSIVAGFHHDFIFKG
jgi:hypothetical protein